jgi:acyl carrier protein
MSSTTFDRVKRLVVKQLKVNESDITMETSFEEDLSADSLDVVELVMEIEEEFGIEVPDEDQGSLKTVGAVVAYVDGKSS